MATRPLLCWLYPSSKSSSVWTDEHLRKSLNNQRHGTALLGYLGGSIRKLNNKECVLALGECPEPGELSLELLCPEDALCDYIAATAWQLKWTKASTASKFAGYTVLQELQDSSDRYPSIPTSLPRHSHYTQPLRALFNAPALHHIPLLPLKRRNQQSTFL